MFVEKYLLTSALKMEDAGCVESNLCLGNNVYVPWKQQGTVFYKKVQITQLGSLEYKKLQKVAAMLRLPGNLKRKQLMASIVARKKGREDIVEAILRSVNNERNIRKNRRDSNASNSNANDTKPEVEAPVASLSFVPCDNAFHRISGFFLRPRPMSNSSYGESAHESIIDSIDLTSLDDGLFSENSGSIQNFLSSDESSISDIPHDSPSCNLYMYCDETKSYKRKEPDSQSFNGDCNSNDSLYNDDKRVCLDRKDDTSSTYSAFSSLDLLQGDSDLMGESEILNVATPPSLTTNTVTTTTAGYCTFNNSTTYNNCIPTATVQVSTFYRLNSILPMPESTIRAIENFDISQIIADIPPELTNTVTELFESREQFRSLLTSLPCSNIIDIMIREIENLVHTPPASSDTEEVSGRPAKPVTIKLKYSEGEGGETVSKNLLTTNPDCLVPIKRFEHGFTSYAYTNSFSSSNCSTNVCFSMPLQGAAHAFEVRSQYKFRACVFRDTKLMLPHTTNPTPAQIPQYCLLHPEYALSYRVPQFYFRSCTTPQNHDEAPFNTYYPFLRHALNRSNLFPQQIHYNVHLPVESEATDFMTSPHLTNLQPKPKIQPRILNTTNIIDLEASIAPLSNNEETYVYKSIENFDTSVTEVYQRIVTNQHKEQCTSLKMYCPYFYTTQCYWFDTLTQIPHHIRQMHPERIVQKNKAEYVIKYMHLEILKNMGVKIIQEYNYRMFFISLCASNHYIYITIQEFCESLEQHPEKAKARLIVKHISGSKVWMGDPHSMHIPLSQLWKPESSIVIPLSLLRSYQSEHFRLSVEIKP